MLSKTNLQRVSPVRVEARQVTAGEEGHDDPVDPRQLVALIVRFVEEGVVHVRDVPLRRLVVLAHHKRFCSQYQ